MSVTTEDVHIALRVDYRDVAIAGRWLGASNQAKFVFVVVCSRMVEPTTLLPSLHLLVVLVEAMVCVFNNERVHHCNRRGSAKAFTAGFTMRVRLSLGRAEVS